MAHLVIMHTKYYYWETIPSWGTRQMGRMDGYDSEEELRRDMAFTIASNEKEGWPCWIMKSQIHMALTASPSAGE